MGGVLSEHSDADIHQETGEPLKQSEKQRSPIKESDQGSDIESKTEHIHQEMGEPLKKSEKQRSPIKESDQGSDSESETEHDIDEGNANQNGCVQVVHSMDDADGDYQGAQDVEVFVRAKLLSTEVHGKQLLKITSVSKLYI